MKKNKILFYAEIAAMVLLTLAAAILTAIGVNVNRTVEGYEFKESCEFIRTTTAEEEDYSEDDTVCAVEYESENGEYTCIVN